MRHVYLTLAETVEIHKQLIEEFGGSHGIRDQTGLEAAIFRPQVGYYGNIIQEAAALMESLANNHAFIDGNKRTSFAGTDTFLRLNGFYLDVEAREAHNFMIEEIAKSTFRFDLILKWLNAHAKTLPEPGP